MHKENDLLPPQPMGRVHGPAPRTTRSSLAAAELPKLMNVLRTQPIRRNMDEEDDLVPLQPMGPPPGSTSRNHDPAPPGSGARTRGPALQIFVAMTCLCAGVFVAALDVTIIATALPAIAAEFQSSAAYTWIGSSYILANTATIPVWGKLSDIWGRKPLLLVAMVVFFVGSLVCAVGQTIVLLLLGRAVQGLGAAGLLTLVNICVSDMFSLRDRGLYFGLVSVAWAAASGVGPVLGGVFTEKITWRWCFWVNLPVTALVFVLLWFTLKLETPKTPIWRGLKAVDWAGCLLVMGSCVMLLLGLDLGGVTYPWKSKTVIYLLVFSIIAMGLFALNEWKLAKHPVIPLVLFHYRSGIAAFVVCFCHGFVFMGEAYYLPLYFQAVLGASPIMSGVYLLPFVLTITLVAAATGLFIQMTGKYVPAVWLGLALMAAGVGHLVDLDVTTNWGKIIGYQILSGAGVGMNFEGPLLALQAIVGVENTATATATIGFIRTLSTAVAVVIGSVVFQDQMANQAEKLAKALGPELAAKLSGGGAIANVELVGKLPPVQRAVARQALYESIRTMWIVYVAFAGFGFIAGFFVGAHHLSKEHKAASLGLKEESDRHARSRRRTWLVEG